jgi:cell division transport system permease protein
MRSALNLRGDSSRRYLPWIIAFMVFLATLTIAAALVVTTAVSSWSGGLAGTMTVQIPPAAGGDAETDAVVGAVVEILRDTPGIIQANAYDKEKSRALLDPWLGDADDSVDLPLPRLIDVRLREDTTIDVAALRARIHERAPDAAIDDHAQWLGNLGDLTRSIQVAATAVVTVIILAAILTVVYATRSGVAVHQGTIEVLHYVGARDGDIARQFAIQALLLGLLGGLIGFALAAFMLGVMSQAAPSMEITTLPSFALETRDWIALGAVPIAAALIATVTARLTVLRTLGRML